MPHINGRVARFELNDFSTVTSLDLTHFAAPAFAGGFTDGKHGYMVPYTHGAEFGTVVRIDVMPHTVTNGWASSP